MPNLKSNIPISPTCGVISSQVVRLFKASNHLNIFIRNVKDRSKNIASCNQDFNKSNLFH